MAKAIRNFITAFLTKWVEDFLILAGITLTVVNTYLISVVDTNIIAGNYLLGIVLIFIGVILARR